MRLTAETKARLILAICVLLPYCRVLSLGFTNFDDPFYVTQNRHVSTGLSWDSIRWALISMDYANWHPVTWLSHMLDCQIYGLDPAGHHVTNVLLHLASTLLLFGVLHKITAALWRSAFVAALFAIHPIHVESVAWVAERKDVLSAFFWMLTMRAYVRYVGERRLSNYLWVIAWLALGLASKPMLVTLPFALLLLDVWPLGRVMMRPVAVASRRRGVQPSPASRASSLDYSVLLEKLPLLALSIASSVITYIAQNKGESVLSLGNLPFHIRLANALIAYSSYVKKAFWPTKLAVFYALSGTYGAWRITFSLAFLGLVTFLAALFWKRSPYLAVGWLWYLGTLIPVIGLVQVGYQSMADRYTYLPSIGLFLILTWAVNDLAAYFKIPRLATRCAVIALIVLCGIGTWVQIGYWKDSNTLFTRAFAVSPDAASIHYSLAKVLYDEGSYREAQSEFRAALQADSKSFLHSIPIRVLSYLGLSDTALAEGDVQAALEYAESARKESPDSSSPYVYLGRIKGRTERYAEAETLLRRACQLEPNDATAHVALGGALLMLGDMAAAEKEIRMALALDQSSANARFSLALLLSRTNRGSQAIPLLREALAIDPKNEAGRQLLLDLSNERIR